MRIADVLYMLYLHIIENHVVIRAAMCYTEIEDWRYDYVGGIPIP